MDAENIAAPVDAVVPELDRRSPRGLVTEGSVGARRELRDMLEKSGGELECCATDDCRWPRALCTWGGDHAHGSQFLLISRFYAFVTVCRTSVNGRWHSRMRVGGTVTAG